MINKDKIRSLERLEEEIYQKGNSHNPEYWQVANELGEYIEELKGGETKHHVIEEAEKDLDNAKHLVSEEAPETVIAVLTDSSDGTCNGCGEYKAMDQDGYCFMCDYDRE